MGQGTDSCGGYDVEYDTYEEGLAGGWWTQRDGSTIKVADMSERHIKNCIHICINARNRASFSCDEDKWNDWIEVFERELSGRKSAPSCDKRAGRAIRKGVPRGSMVQMICHCGVEYSARSADLKRGWGLSCSKRCAAIRREFGRPHAKRKV